MSNELPNHLKPVLGRVVNVTGMLKPEEALAVAVHHLAVSVTALSTMTGMRRGEARRKARDLGDQVIDLVSDVYDQAARAKK